MSFYIDQKGETCGPYTAAELRSMWTNGVVTGETLFCEEGYDSWLRLRVLAEELELLHQSPPTLPPTTVPPIVRTKNERGSKTPLLVGGAIIAIGAILLTRTPPALPDQQPTDGTERPSGVGPSASVAAPRSDTVTEEYARRINAFADKHDMTVNDVIRRDYALGKRGLTLRDYDQALDNLERSQNKVVGYHVQPKKRNLGDRRLHAGDTTPPQNPTLTESEESMVRLLKLAGY